MKRACLLLFVNGLLLADFRYEQTTRITKGMVMKMPFGKKPEPSTTTLYMKGSRMASLSKDGGTIFDFDKQTFTVVEMEKKRYWTVTFDEMKQAMEDMQADLKKASNEKNASIDMKFDAKATGVTKEVSGVSASQVIFTIEPQVSDGKQTGPSMKMVADSWHSEAVPGYGEYKSFYERLKDKGNWMGMGNPMAQMGGQKGMAEGMRKLAEEMQKTPGIAVLTITRMTMPGMNFSMSGGGQDGSQNGGQPAEGNVKDGVAGAAKQAGGQAVGQRVGGPLGGMVGGALGGRLGGFGRKKKEEALKTETAPAPPVEPAPAQTNSNDGALLMESFTESSGFSTAPIAEDVFAVPAGFTKVTSPMLKERKR